jgi:hypothetical protein
MMLSLSSSLPLVPARRSRRSSLRSLLRPLFLAFLLVFSLLVWAAQTAPANASLVVKPFEITKFTMQPTGPTRQIPAAQERVFEFVNEPQPFTQAGGHPWALTTTIEVATELAGGASVPTRDARNVVVGLPPGLLGNPVALPRCPIAQALGEGKQCPPSTQVGVYRIRWFGGKELLSRILNVTPEAGQSAEFVLESRIGINFVLAARLVRTEHGYGIAVDSNAIPQTIGMSRIELTFWGVPADPSHDALRGLICDGPPSLPNKPLGGPGALPPLECPSGTGLGTGNEPDPESPVPFLIWPTDCSQGAGTATLRADSWQEPGSVGVNQQYVGYQEREAVLPGATGCDLLGFAPTIDVEPSETLADEPVGLGVNIGVPQTEKPAELATPQLRDAVVTLPEGISVSPGVVGGVRACDASGPEGINFTGPESEEVGLNGELQLAPGKCPDASTVGTAEAITPLLSAPVKGHVYLARPGCGGVGQSACTNQDALDGNLYQLYLELGGTGAFGDAGIQIKVPGRVQANPATGQLTTVFADNPQAPFSDLKVKLNGGARAPLANPAVCGPAVTSADFTPWSEPGRTPEGLLVAGTPDGLPSSFFNVDGCPAVTPFSPGFSAGTVTPQAGQFSAFTLNFTHQDREQYLSGIQVHTPPGLVGMLSSVPLCGEPQAAQGTCPESSKIGTTRVASGAGSEPFEISGNVYLTAGYKGAPFGLSIVTNAVAGPFNLGLVVVRSRINVDPVTSQLTVTSDPLPQIIFGVPLRLKQVTVNIDRPGFMFNPTSCSAQRITAVLSGSQNATANVQMPFAAGGCRSLAFQPRFTVTTSGHTSKRAGASLDAKVTYPSFRAGAQANISYVKVELPKQLPSRLTTLQKACLAAVFDANPANCPPASIVGIVRASTPVLPVPLTGPVYFVSHGGEAFPSLIAVLQGDGVRVDLTGTTFIDKHGITSSTFKTVPDVPVTTFELYLPEGPYSALTANTNLCKAAAKLNMPSEFIAQNRAVIKKTTKIAVTGCPKPHKTKKHAKKSAARHRGSHR